MCAQPLARGVSHHGGPVRRSLHRRLARCAVLAPPHPQLCTDRASLNDLDLYPARALALSAFVYGAQGLRLRNVLVRLQARASGGGGHTRVRFVWLTAVATVMSLAFAARAVLVFLYSYEPVFQSWARTRRHNALIFLLEYGAVEIFPGGLCVLLLIRRHGTDIAAASPSGQDADQDPAIAEHKSQQASDPESTAAAQETHEDAPPSGMPATFVVDWGKAFSLLYVWLRPRSAEALLLNLATFCTAVNQTAVVPLLYLYLTGDSTVGFTGTAAWYGLVLAAYSLGQAAAGTPCVWLVQRWSPRTVLLLLAATVSCHGSLAG